MLVVSNASSVPKEISIKIPKTFWPPNNMAISVLNNAKYNVKNGVIHLELDPYEFLWIDLDPKGHY